jgi:hypothetical protein
LLYRQSSSPFEVFARSKSKAYFEHAKVALGIVEKYDLVPVLDAFEGQGAKLEKPRWDFVRVEPEALVGFDTLASSP